jgi:hypothetical protein
MVRQVREEAPRMILRSSITAMLDSLSALAEYVPDVLGVKRGRVSMFVPVCFQ